jgi:thioredoxin reductase
VIGTVDLVVAGEGRAARTAAVSALRRGQRVLVVLASGDPQAARRLRRTLRRTIGAGSGRVQVMSSAEVVCVDGVDGVEAVVVRHVATRNLSAVNASAFLSCDGQKR